jgi:CRP-like cAMP-binding protein
MSDVSLQRFLANINRHTQLSPTEELALCSITTHKLLKKRELLLRNGEVCSHEYYVVKGCLRSYYTDDKGLEHNIYFAVEDWWISDLYSRTLSTPAFCNIIAVEDCELIQLTHAGLESFLSEHPSLERFFRLSYQHSLAQQHLKTMQLLTMTGEERYNYFREKYPEFDKRIPQKHIATYLGFTPEFFNTIRSKALRQK